jgi:hypothetical protein
MQTRFNLAPSVSLPFKGRAGAGMVEADGDTPLPSPGDRP